MGNQPWVANAAYDTLVECAGIHESTLVAYRDFVVRTPECFDPPENEQYPLLSI